MIRFNFYIGLLMLILLSSCKKEELPDVHSTDPVFYMEYEDDGQSQSIVAGDDSWELQTGTSQFLGYHVNFGQFFNVQNQSYFRLDYISNTEHELLDDILHLSNADFFELPDKIIEKIIVDGDLPNIQSIKWSINGGPYSLVDLSQISGPGEYDICFKVSFSEGCERELCNTFNLGIARDVQARYYVEDVSATQKICVANIQGDYDQIEWDLNGVSYDSGSSITLDSLQQGLYNLNMKVIKDGEIKGEWKTLVPVGNVLCDFRFFDIKSTLLEEIQKGLIFSYQNSQGDVYNSSMAEQQGSVTITEIEKYPELNEYGQQVISFKAQGVVSMENALGEIKTMNLQNVKMAVAI